MGLLVEAFPAAQLHQWELFHKGYSRDDQDGRSKREKILRDISPRIKVSGDLHAACRKSGDALDSVLCLFAAKAAAAGQAPVYDPTAAELEGWIAVHPQ